MIRLFLSRAWREETGYRLGLFLSVGLLALCLYPIVMVGSVLDLIVHSLTLECLRILDEL